MNFKSNLSYSNSKSTEYGDINTNDEIQSIKEEMQTGIGFKPIASFSGTFDGQNFEIRNLYVNSTGNSGLFATSYATIKNLGITGEINTTGNNAGGIAGKNHGDACKIYIYNSYNSGSLKASIAGGIYGQAHGGTKRFTNCYNKGEIVGNNAGGLTGYNYFDIPIINNCFNIGKIESTSDIKAGGITGKVAGFTKENLKRAYYLNTIDVAAGNNSYKGNAFTAEYMQSQEFVDLLNSYVDTYETDDDDVTLLKWKYNKGNYPTFE